jgi:hypothetical protein
VKVIQLLPLAFLADVHGFIYFVPYMFFVMFIAQMVAFSRRRSRKGAEVTTHLSAGIDSTEVEDAVLAFANS